MVIPVSLLDTKHLQERGVWQQYRLSTGERLPDFDASSAFEATPSMLWPDAMIVVPGTPLTLAHGEADGDSWFMLLDASYKIVWSLHLRGDITDRSGDRKHWRMLHKIVTGGAILPSPGACRFAILCAAQDARIAYSVAQDSSGQWRVVETGRERYTMPIPPLPRVPGIALRHVGHFDLTVPGSPPLPTALSSVALTFMGPGRIVIKDRRTAAIHVFDSRGRWLHACLPDKKDGFQDEAYFLKVFTSAGDDLFVYDRDYPPKPMVHFGPDGRRIGVLMIQPESPADRRFAEDRLTGDLRHAPGWGCYEDSIDFVDARGRVLQSVERRADSRWLHYIRSVSPVTGGTFAVLDGDGDKRGHVSMYSAAGTPVSTFTLPDAPAPSLGDWDGMAYNGRLVVVSAGRTLYGVTPRGRFLWRFTPRSSGARLRPFFADGGETLLVWSGGTHIDRYALPR
jgi:hypothetical protein